MRTRRACWLLTETIGSGGRPLCNDAQEEVSGAGAFEQIKSTINCKLIEESQNDQYKKCSDCSFVAICGVHGLRFSNLMAFQCQN